MSIRDLPAAQVGARPGVRSGVSPEAIRKWNADLRAATASEGGQGDVDTISILDAIGQDWYGEGVTAKRISAALRSIGKKPVTVLVNSPGGDFFEGLAIYNVLREHPEHVTVKVLGLAASAASVIAMAADEVQIARAGFLMIHNTWVASMGDRHALREVADWLAPFDAAAVDLYAARTGIEPKAIATMLDRETWIGGQQAVDQGFADTLLGSDQIASGASQSSGRTIRAEKKFDLVASTAGLSRTDSRDLLAQIKGGTPGAALSDLPVAVVLAEVDDLLNRIRAI